MQHFQLGLRLDIPDTGSCNSFPYSLLSIDPFSAIDYKGLTHHCHGLLASSVSYSLTHTIEDYWS
jgi:hypothetical protein